MSYVETASVAAGVRVRYAAQQWLTVFTSQAWTSVVSGPHNRKNSCQGDLHLFPSLGAFTEIERSREGHAVYSYCLKNEAVTICSYIVLTMLLANTPFKN